MDQASIQHLLVADAFPHPVTDFQLIETHISWVILTGDFAYKIKKPVDLGFLDFRELARRQHYCTEELSLNRRYTPEIYLDVVPVTGTEEVPQIDGAGPVLDYAVKMQQFATANLLGSVSKAGDLNAPLVRSIAAELAKSHRNFPSIHTATDNPAAMQAAMFQNFDQVREYAIDDSAIAQLDSLEEWTRTHIARSLPLMTQRLQQGNIKDLHGDLHLNNMVLLDGKVRFFDCIEFNEHFRVMDTIAEIAFVAMDMANRGESAQQVLNDYFEYRGDYAGLPLLNLYRVYFAMVRAKVNLMREPTSNSEVQATAAYQNFKRFVKLAMSYTKDEPPFIALMHGVSGSGKSTIAAQVAERFGAIRLRSDVERKRLFGLSPDDSSEAIEADIYTKAASKNTFEQLAVLCRGVVEAGLPCIVDATFLEQSGRKPFIELAENLNVAVIIIDCIASANTLATRLQYRTQHANDASEADIEIMQKQLSTAEAFSANEIQYVLTIDTEKPFDGGPIAQQLQQSTA
jgi:aminoglycoside phosphotransferase family enzyme/predicted kinase